MTSNVGAREIAQDASVGFGTTGEQGLTSSEIRGRAMGELKRLFRPELLNRIDDIVVFQKLSGENLTKIAHLLVDDLRQRLIANGMNIKLTDAAYDKIVAEGTDLCVVPSKSASRIRCPRSCWPASGARAIPSCATWSTASLSLATARVRFRRRVRRVHSGAIPLRRRRTPETPHL